MNKVKHTLVSVTLISLFTTLNSCNGQNNTKKTEDAKNEIGVTVSKIDNAIWVIYQDKKSNFWFGSKENGVFYYDGKLLINYTTNDGLISNEIRGIQEDSKGNIYFDTGKGVSKFDGKIFRTLPIVNPNSPTNDWVLKPDDLWFRIDFTNNGVYRFDGDFLHYLKFPKSPQEEVFFKTELNSNLKPYGLYSIYKDRNGFMWFGTSHLGFCRYDGETFSWYYEDQLQNTPSGGSFGSRAIFEDKEGKFWINNTQFRYNILSNSDINLTVKKESGIGFKNENNQLEFPFFLSITDDNYGNLWMVTYENGVWKYDGEKLIHYPVLDGKKNAFLFTSFKDKNGILWLGSHNAGVYKFNGNSFEKYEKWLN